MSMALTTNEVDTTRTENDRVHSFGNIIKAYLHAKYSERRNAAKALARDASWLGHTVSHHTARAWLKGRTQPSMESIEVLAARCEDLARKLDEERAKLRSAVNR
jgi:hypothetical protein